MSRRIDYVVNLSKKLFSARGLQRLVSEPGVVAKHARNFIQNYNMTKWSPAEILQRDHDGLESLAEMLGDQEGDLTRWLPVIDDANVEDLANLFRGRGSDKATMHDYHRLYGSILSSKRNHPINILEIGLGTNNPSIPSNMSVFGKPGASLRAWRDWAPNANIYGADIDRDILFSEPRIETFWVDQTKPETLRNLAARLPIQFDLIIDDGLHEPNANINTFRELIGRLKPDGVFVIEDITLCPQFWTVATRILSINYDVCLYKMKVAHILAVRTKR